MKKILFVTTILLLPALLSAEELPARKPGLWEISITSDAAGSKPVTMKQCIDAATDVKMMQMGSAMAQRAGAQCTKKDIHREGNKFVGGSDCTINGNKIGVNVSFSGDFSTQYSGETDTTYDPPVLGSSKRHSSISAKWAGACAADQVPGDMIMSNGMKMNINSLPQLPPQPPK